MTTWHVAAADLRRYAAGTADIAVAASVEAHVVRCGACAAALAPAVDTGRLDSIWAEVADVVDAPRRTPLERLLTAFGVSEATARLLAATPNLRTGWFGALGVVLVLALSITALGGREGDSTPLLLLAPLLPVIGVAAAFGRYADPAYDLTIAAPYSTLRLLLLRSAAVLVTCVALTALVALLLPGAEGTAAWLLPALGLTLGTLALATWWTPPVAAAAVGGTWTLLVAEVAHRRGLADLTSSPAQLTCAALAALAATVLVRRRRCFDQEGTR